MLPTDRGLDVQPWRQDKAIRVSHLRNGHLNATENALDTHNRPVLPGTVRNRLRDAGVRARHTYVGPALFLAQMADVAFTVVVGNASRRLRCREG